MRKLVALGLVLVTALLLPLELASARGGRPGGGVGRSGGLRRSWSSRSSRKDATKLRERKRLENADSLLRDAAGSRRLGR